MFKHQIEYSELAGRWRRYPKSVLSWFMIHMPKGFLEITPWINSVQ